MAEGWLRKVVETTKSPWRALAARFADTYLRIVGAVAILSDVGFSATVTAARGRIHLIVAILALAIAPVWQLKKMHRDLVVTRRQNDQLRQSLDKLQGQRDQARLEALERLRTAALFGLMRNQWREARARITQFRIMEADSHAIQPSKSGQESVERLDVIINIGMKHSVRELMGFVVRDPTASLTHGLVEVTSVEANGSICRLVRLDDRAFWADALEACQAKGPSVLDAADNAIVPDSPWPSISEQGAKEVIAWLGQIEREWR